MRYLSIVLLIVVIAGCGGGDVALPTVAVLPSVTSSPTETATATSTPSVTPSATVTSSPTATFTPTLTFTPTASPTATFTATNSPTPLPTITPLPSNTATPAGSEELALLRAGMNMIDVDVFSVEIADGRPNGGDKVIIVGFNSQADTETEFFGELGSIIGIVGGALRNDVTDIDALVMVVGSRDGAMAGTVAADADDILAFVNEEITALQMFERLIID